MMRDLRTTRTPVGSVRVLPEIKGERRWFMIPGEPGPPLNLWGERTRASMPLNIGREWKAEARVKGEFRMGVDVGKDVQQRRSIER